MKPEPNRKHLTFAVYALIVSLIGIVFIFFLINFDRAMSFLSNILNICSPIMYGALIAYILNPLTSVFEDKLLRPRKKNSDSLSRTTRRIFAVVLTILSFLIFLLLFIWMLLPQLTESIKDLGEKFPSYLEAIEELANGIAAQGGVIASAIESLLTTLNDFIDNSYDILKQYLPMLTTMLQSFAVGALDVVLGFVFAVYFLLAKEHLLAQIKKILRSLCKETTYHNILRIVSLADDTFGKYFTGAILDSILVGILCFILMSILGMPYAPLISVIIAITNVIPFFGPFIGAIPSAIILFVANPIYAVYFAVMILVLQQIDGNIIAPRIHSSSTGLAPVWVIVAITVMSGLFGFIGMFIGVPLFSVLYTLVKEQVEMRLAKKSLPLETVNYMSELGRAYCEKPEKEKKPWKKTWASMIAKAPKLKHKDSPAKKPTDKK